MEQFSKIILPYIALINVGYVLILLILLKLEFCIKTFTSLPLIKVFVSI